MNPKTNTVDDYKYKLYSFSSKQKFQTQCVILYDLETINVKFGGNYT